MPKVLMPLYQGQHVGSSNAQTAYGLARIVWETLGYTVETVVVDPTDTMLTSTTPGVGVGDAADILCFPYVNTDLSISTVNEYGNACYRGTAQVPTFVMYFNNTPTVNYLIGGIQDRVSATLAYEKAYWGSDQIFTAYTRKYSDWEDTGAAGGLVTPLIADNWPPVRGVDNIFAWKWESDASTNNSPTYICAGTENTNMLVCMIQEAVNRGDIPAPPKKKKVFFDFDDFPMALTTAAEVDTVYAKMAEHGLKGTCGVHGSFNPSSNAGDAQVLNYLDTFTITDHQVTGNTYFFDWDANLGETKAQMDTKHRANVAAMQALGTKMKLDSGGYRFFNQNAINTKGLALLSPDTSIANDPAETAPQAGYGLNIVRMDEVSANRGNNNLTVARFSKFNAPQQGMQIANYRTVSNGACNAAGVAADDATFNVAVLPIWRGIMHTDFAPEYMSVTGHNVDFYSSGQGAGGDGSGAGTTQWERAVDFIVKCKDIYKPLDPRSLSFLPTNFSR